MADENDLKVAREIGQIQETLKHHGKAHDTILSTLRDIRDGQITDKNRLDAIESEAVTKTTVMKAALVVGGGGGLAGSGIFTFIKNIIMAGAN
jgi:hypothetical protein